jgi:hypothetical protein
MSDDTLELIKITQKAIQAVKDSVQALQAHKDYLQGHIDETTAYIIDMRSHQDTKGEK